MTSALPVSSRAAIAVLVGDVLAGYGEQSRPDQVVIELFRQDETFQVFPVFIGFFRCFERYFQIGKRPGGERNDLVTEDGVKNWRFGSRKAPAKRPRRGFSIARCPSAWSKGRWGRRDGNSRRHVSLRNRITSSCCPWERRSVFVKRRTTLWRVAGEIAQETEIVVG